MNRGAQFDPRLCRRDLHTMFFPCPVTLAVTACLLILFVAVRSGAQGESQIQVDPQTGRAIGAREISPEELKRLFDSRGKTLIIDVRDSSSFEKETIPGAIHIPLDKLKSKLKEIPKDTTLAFT